ncbi:endonuclease/exonuclease/phosphatase family protein [Maricaulis sp.]|uniref:endonuclease/exonuclease/phosphatase family protein n=1 Tax=Maricaulis sp. TaxID=1486257 RepID=UPI003A93D029
MIDLNSTVLLNIALAALGLVAACLWLASLAPVFDLFRHAWPLWVIVALVVIGAAVWTGHWREAGLAGILLVLILLPARGEFTASLRQPSATSGRASLTLVTHNLWGKGGERAGAVAAILTEDAPDLIALQEVRSDGLAVAAALAADYPFAADCGDGPTRLLSRHPFVRSGCLDGWKPAYRLPGLRVMPAAWGEIAMPDGERVVIVAVHLPWPEPLNAQAAVIEALTILFEGFEADRLIVLGDFNAAPPAVIHERMARDWGLERRTHGLPSWPSQSFTRAFGLPRLPVPSMLAGIDHVYAGTAWQTQSVSVLADTGSDHRPVQITLSLQDAAR